MTYHAYIVKGEICKALLRSVPFGPNLVEIKSAARFECLSCLLLEDKPKMKPTVSVRTRSRYVIEKSQESSLTVSEIHVNEKFAFSLRDAIMPIASEAA